MSSDIDRVMRTGIVLNNGKGHVSIHALNRMTRFERQLMAERARRAARADLDYRATLEAREAERRTKMAPGVASAIGKLMEVQRETKYRNIARQESAMAREAARAAEAERAAAARKPRLPIEILRRIGEYVAVKPEYDEGPFTVYGKIKKLADHIEEKYPDDGNWEAYFPEPTGDQDKWVTIGGKDGYGYGWSVQEELLQLVVNLYPDDPKYAKLLVEDEPLNGGDLLYALETRRINGLEDGGESLLEESDDPEDYEVDGVPVTTSFEAVESTVTLTGSARQKEYGRAFLKKLFTDIGRVMEGGTAFDIDSDSESEMSEVD